MVIFFQHFYLILSDSLSGVLGVDESVKKSYCKTMTEKSKVVSILTLAERAGMSTGIVTTTRATHATHASSYAHSVNRDWESDKDIKSKDDGTTCKDIGKQMRFYLSCFKGDYIKKTSLPRSAYLGRK